MGVVEWTFLLLTPVTYFAMLTAERLWPARAFPPRRGWQWTGTAFLILSMAIGVTLPLFLPWDWIASVRWLDGSGLDPLAAAVTGYLFTLYALFQHMNVRTPQWLGYIIQRPESHSLHHARGVHFYDFSDLPLWDILFGTFRNPESYAGPCGFEDGPDRRIGAMLFFQDVNAPVYGAGSLGVQPSGAR